MPALVSRLTPGKIRRRLADAEGRFAVLVVDQRRSLFQVIAARAGRAEADVAPGEVTGYGAFPDRRAALDPDTETSDVA